MTVLRDKARLLTAKRRVVVKSRSTEPAAGAVAPASQEGDRLARGLALSLAVCFVLGTCTLVTGKQPDSGTGPCYEVPEYTGINAIPAMTMQIRPALGGDTVVNDAEYPPGTGPLVVVGFWEHAEESYQPKPGENPCAGEPTMKIAFPVAYGSERCYGWRHWVKADPPDDLHPNSATEFACREGVFSYRQWTTMDCRPDEEVPFGTAKDASPTKCCQDMPRALWSQLLSGCGKEPPGRPRP